MLKASAKARRKKPAKDGPIHAQMRKASRPNPRSKKSEHQRMREATKPRRKKMTDAAAQTPPANQARGREANIERTRLIDWPPEPKSHAEHVEELLAQAQANEDFNNEVNAVQTAQAKAFIETAGRPQGDPLNDDDERAASLKAYQDENDPAAKKARLKGEMDARARRNKAASAA